MEPFGRADSGLQPSDHCRSFHTGLELIEKQSDTDGTLPHWLIAALHCAWLLSVYCIPALVQRSWCITGEQHEWFPTWWFVAGLSEVYKVFDVFLDVALFQRLPHFLIQLQMQKHAERMTSHTGDVGCVCTRKSSIYFVMITSMWM